VAMLPQEYQESAWEMALEASAIPVSTVTSNPSSIALPTESQRTSLLTNSSLIQVIFHS